MAIRLAVRDGSGFPPFAMAAMRTLAAGVILLLWVGARKQRLWPTAGEWKVLVPCGLLLWIGGNGLVTWAAEKSDSGFAALRVGTLPLWTALVESVAYRKRPSVYLGMALLVGFSGLAVLHWHALGSPNGTPWPRLVALIAAPCCWSVGSVIQVKYAVKLVPAGSAAWQQLVEFVGFVFVSLVVGEPKKPARPICISVRNKW